MSTKEKLLNRIQQIPKDFTFSELETLLKGLGFIKFGKGKTSGSRVVFVRKTGLGTDKLIVHKPHPQNTIKTYAIKQILEKLIDFGDIIGEEE